MSMATTLWNSMFGDLVDKEKQEAPKGDNRRRVHRSVKCYLAELGCGIAFCTWDFRESIERVVYLFPTGKEYKEMVQHNNRFYALQTPERMLKIIHDHLADGGSVNLPGKSIRSSKDDFDPYPFIDITSADDLSRYPKLRELWLNQNYIFNDETLEYEFAPVHID